MSTEQQCLIENDKKNPYLTVCRDNCNPGYLYVYTGLALIEVVPDDKSSFEFKLLIARLYNSKVKVKSINKAFGVARTTMKRWGNAIKSGDLEKLIEALSGQGAPRKMTPEVKAFVKCRFRTIYRENHYNYSGIIRDEIKEVFKKDISAETLRPIFNDLKKNVIVSTQEDESGCEPNLGNTYKNEFEGIIRPEINNDSNENSKSSVISNGKGNEILSENKPSDKKEGLQSEIAVEVSLDDPMEDIKGKGSQMTVENNNDTTNLNMKSEEQGEFNKQNFQNDREYRTTEKKQNDEPKERANICDSNELNIPIRNTDEKRVNEKHQPLVPKTELQPPLKPNPNISIDLSTRKKMFCHHAGALIFSFELSKFCEFIRDDLAKQLLLTVLLGAKNIEQTKLLDFNAIKAMLGIVTQNLNAQRKSLAKMSTEDNIRELLKFNAKLVNAEQYDDFYFDPHTKHYTGTERILKGWCAGTKSANKIINMDFIHTAPDGYPVYVEDSDNFFDLRERFLKEIDDFREILGCDEKIMTFIVDRGIFSNNIFEIIAENEKNHIITWEKGYKVGEWDEKKVSGAFSTFRCRNNSRDFRKFRYDFKYIDQIWEKNDKIRQIIVRSTNHKGRKIEVSILTDDKDRNAEEIIELIFSRWIQENDFKYENEHFGINEITTYSKVSYSEIKNLVKDKETIRGKYKARKKEADVIRRKLKNALLKERTIKCEKRKNELEIEIIKLKKDYEEAVDLRANTKKKGSKLDELIKNNYKRLNTSNKKYMDCIKIIARNIFYKALGAFKEKYNNYRDDHVLFRNLTQAHGVIKFNNKEVYVTIFPTAHLQPKVRKIIEEVFEEINKKEPKLPDGSGRIVKLRLGNKNNNLLLLIQQKFVWGQ